MSYFRWLQYVHFFAPNIKLARSKEDVCDGCFAIDTELSNPYIAEERKEELLALKKTHIDDAVVQRRAMQAIIKQLINKHVPGQQIPDNVMLLPDYIEDPLDGYALDPLVVGVCEEETKSEGRFFFSANSVTAQGEDFGGGLGFPFYGFSRPSIDYYQSNLILHNFVMSDITSKLNHIYYYDERGQDKGADAVCSLRLRYHLRKLQSDKPPTTSISILDSCVGQNKSQTVMKFFAFLSICFYEKVVLLYLKSGHSHMLPDRATAHAKNSVKNRNIYHPKDLVSIVNTVQGLKAEFLDHNAPKHHFLLAGMR